MNENRTRERENTVNENRTKDTGMIQLRIIAAYKLESL